MAKDQPWKAKGMKKDEWLAEEVAKAVGAGKPWACETVDFSDPDRSPTCIEVDFPIIPIHEIAAIEGNAGSVPSDFADRGWVFEEKKVFHLTPPLDLARAWTNKHRKGMQSDYDQALFLVGACFEGSGINVNETLGNPNFRPHPALGALLTWLKTHGADTPTRNAAAVAASLYQTWAAKNQTVVKQLDLFEALGEEAG